MPNLHAHRLPRLDRQHAIWQGASMKRKAVRLTPDQRNTELRRMALDQYTRALQDENEPLPPSERPQATARCFFARAVLLEALGV